MATSFNIVCPYGSCQCWCNILDGTELLSKLDDDVDINPSFLNEVPFDDDVPILQSGLRDAEQDLETLDTHIAHVQNILDILKDWRQTRATNARYYRFAPYQTSSGRNTLQNISRC